MEMLPQRYQCFDDFPNNIKKLIKTITKDDYEAFIRGVIPAVGKSLLEIINGPNGEQETIKKLGRMISGH
ncbi:MAG: hypothetical protein ACYTER_08910 [Planctomycetota bacterium]|jgi:hypothetical protein